MRSGGRIYLIIGILLVALVAVGAIWYLQQGGSLASGTQTGQPVLPPTVEPRQKVVVANIDIPNNTVLTDTETYLKIEEIPESEYNANPSEYFTSPSELSNYVALRTILATEKVLKRDVVEAGLSLKIPAGQDGQPSPKAMVFEVDNLQGVADQITPGDYVDFLASFDITRTSIRPSTGTLPESQSPPATGVLAPTPGVLFVETDVTEKSTKTLVQNVQVLDIRKPAVQEPSGTPEAGGSTVQPAEQGPPQTGPDGQPVQNGQSGTASGQTYQPNAKWLIILAVTDQQAEVIKYALEKATAYTLVLRGRGDTAGENTMGATLDILISRYGLPVPIPEAPAVGPVTQLTPLPATAVPPTVTP